MMPNLQGTKYAERHFDTPPQRYEITLHFLHQPEKFY